ncbi:hypothetical protein [Heyndrickxia faecalis]
MPFSANTFFIFRQVLHNSILAAYPKGKRMRGEKMKKEYMLALLALWFMAAGTVVIADAGGKTKAGKMVIHRYEADVTGDGKKDAIILEGIPFAAGSPYMKKIWARIAASEGKKYKLPYEPGYEPEIRFTDLNHDGVKDMLGSSNSGGSGGINQYRLDTLKGGILKYLPMPPVLKLSGKFENALSARLNIENTNETFLIDLRKRKKDYIRLGIYQKDGMLNEPFELMIDPVAVYKPVKIKGKKGCGLEGYQQISGAYHADKLGDVKATWYFEDGKWILVRAKWQPANA